MKEKRTSLEYELRPYVNPGEPYSKFIRTVPDRFIGNQELAKHSEFKKPYLSESYQEMEYKWDSPIVPYLDLLWPDLLYGRPGRKKKITEIFLCFVNDCFTPGVATVVEFFCTQPCKAVKHKWGVPGGWTISANCNTVTITSPLSECDGVQSPQDFVVDFGDGEGYTGGFIVRGCSESWFCKGDDHITPVSIGYTTQQMSLSSEQTLSVTNPATGTTYYWAVSGGGSLSAATGLSVIYDSAATNSECTNNGTITLTDCVTCDTLEIAVNADANNYTAYFISTTSGATCTWEVIKTGYRCNGDLSSVEDPPATCFGCDCPTFATCQHLDGRCACNMISNGSCGCDCPQWPHGCDCQWGNWLPNASGDFCTELSVVSRCVAAAACGTKNGFAVACSGISDVRTAAMRTAGCCPSALL